MDFKEFSDIPEYSTWKSIEFIDKGWSLDKKYKVTNNNNEEFVLRISNISRYEEKLEEYKIVQQFYTTGIDMCEPISFGKSIEGEYCYMILTWVNGEQAELVLPTLDYQLQYSLGYQAGVMLKKMHSINVTANNLDWREYYYPKHYNRIKLYRETGINNNIVEKMIEFCDTKLNLLKETIKCQSHGDFHVGNLIIDEKNKISVIDFNRVKMADPYFEFNRISISANVSKSFARGQINGYFENDVPESFFEYLKFYRLSILIGTIPWSLQFTNDDLAFSIKTINNAYTDYNELKAKIPNWYFS